MNDAVRDAREQIRGEIDRLFENAPKTRAVWELQEELLANCMERYNDLLADGVEQDAAVSNVVNSIGDVDELIATLPGIDDDNVLGFAWDAQRRRNSAVIITIAVGMYIFSAIAFFIGLYLSVVTNAPSVLFIGLIIAGIICVIPTCMLVYNAYRWPKYERQKDTVVENFKQWNNSDKRVKAIRRSISSLLWLSTVAVYMLISFWTGMWHLTWIIFLVSTCIETILSLVFKLKELP